MKNKLQLVTFISLLTLLVVSIINNYFQHLVLIGWAEIVVITFVIFVAIGDRIKAFKISATGISVEQELAHDQKQVNDYIESNDGTEQITNLIEESLEHPRDIWSKLLFIRITLRRLLRKVAETNGIKCHDTIAMLDLITTLHKRKIIDYALAQNIEKIRNSTFVIEWGAGESAEPSELEFTLKNYASVFGLLKKCVRNSRT